MTTVERCEPLAVNWHKMLTVSRKSCHHIKTPKYSKDFFFMFLVVAAVFFFFFCKKKTNIKILNAKITL